MPLINKYFDVEFCEQITFMLSVNISLFTSSIWTQFLFDDYKYELEKWKTSS